MAFIYRYQIKNKKKRKEVNLDDYKEEIIEAITSFYDDKLKDCRVQKDFYEYKLYSNVGNETLQLFGKHLIRNCPGLSAIWNQTKKRNSGFFIRKDIEYYALCRDEQNDSLSIEMVDVTDFDEYERTLEQAIRYRNNYWEKYRINLQNNRDALSINNLDFLFYMDVFNLYIKGHSEIDKYIFNDKTELVLIKGYHKREKEKTKIVAISDIYRLRDVEGQDLQEEESSDVLEDGFTIKSVKPVEEEKKNRIRNMMNSVGDKIEPATEIKNGNYSGNIKNINFIVHNVGQGLATSITDDKGPFLYFDFGIGEGNDSSIIPKNMSIDLSRRPSIIISHIHRDHWGAISKFTEAVDCEWYIPNQDLQIEFSKRCTEIMHSNGKVRVINTPIRLSFGDVILPRKFSKHKPKRESNHKHDDGLMLKLELYSEGGDKVNILVPGDQRYDYIEDDDLKEIDVLVASHHGGEYSWSKRGNVDDDIPTNTKQGIIIYSYGKGNEHGHPSKESDYSKKGWSDVHRTPFDNDYKLK